MDYNEKSVMNKRICNSRRLLAPALSFIIYLLSFCPAGAQSKYIQAVDEYVPAPGQFVNTLPAATADDTPATMAAKCTERLAGGAGEMITLGACGGYVTFHFDHPVANVAGEMDFYISGNYTNNGSEPGIVMVSQDSNHNQLPDDAWYELGGSADTDSVGKVAYGYSITYRRNGDLSDVAWTDSRGTSGSVPRNGFHKQEYFPLWLGTDELTFSGTLLPRNGYNSQAGGQLWLLTPLRYGYVDNAANSDTVACSFNIDWAVDPLTRQPVSLSHVDFIRVYTAQNQVCGWIGETSTEVAGAEDLHLEASLQIAAGIATTAAAPRPKATTDLTGRRIDSACTPKKGIYIINGKKTIFK